MGGFGLDWEHGSGVGVGSRVPLACIHNAGFWVAGSRHMGEEVWCRKSLCRALSTDIWESAVPCHSLPGHGGAPTWVMAGKQLPALVWDGV